MKKTLKEIANIINGKVIGDDSIVVTGISGIKEAKPGDLTFIANSKYISLLEQTRASAVITSPEITSSAKPLIQTDNPSLAFAKMVSLLAPNEVHHPEGIDKTAVIGKNVKLGKNVAIEAYCVIRDNAVIGDDTIIYAGVSIGHNTKIGNGCLLYPKVAIRERVEIGNRVIIHSGAVMGSDGFGFSTVEGVHHKIPQIGTVVIEDDVEIGANVTIDRARFGKTLIGKGTKIDNLVQIAHNVIIGEHSIIVAQSGISGSTTLGKNVIMAGQSGIVGHLMIGDNTVIAARSVVTKSLPPNSCVSGYPAKPHAQAKRINAHIQRLPEMANAINELKKRIEELEKRNP